MASETWTKLRIAAFWPSFALFLFSAWMVVSGWVTSQIKDKLTASAIDVYVPLGFIALMVWGLSNGLKTYRGMAPAAGTDEGRYWKSSKTFSFISIIIVLSLIFLGGFGIFAGSFAGIAAESFLDRLILSYIPIIIDAAILAYGVYFGLVSNRGGTSNE